MNSVEGNFPFKIIIVVPIVNRARERKYFYPQIVLTCIDKVEAKLEEEEMERLGRRMDDYERE